MAGGDNKWKFWIDRGGTFTDVIARAPDGTIATRKYLSENPAQYEDAALAAIADLLEVAPGQPLPAGRIGEIRMGTTVATNALLERDGAPTLLVTTRGFADVLRIGTQNRPRLFDLNIHLPEMLYSQVLEVDERLDARGNVLKAPDPRAVADGLKAAFDAGIRAVAIVFMHGYRHGAHEDLVAALCRQVGFTQISVSHRLVPLMKIVGRGDTCVADAYLSPVLRRYVDRVARATGGARLLFMQSNGGLAEAHRFRGKDAILSGPAGGIIGAVETAAVAGENRLVGFDMGGTSTDVCHFDGTFERVDETMIGGHRLRAPMMRIHTVAAGGGSILHFDGARFRVGPDSAGARPGPACYRGGGPLTVTDANLLLGRLDPAYFPASFGPAADARLDTAVVRKGFTRLADEIDRAGGGAMSAEAVAEGFLAIAIDNMARAIRRISVERGYDVEAYTLVSFGGAGGQHACRLADALGMTRVLIHPRAGVLSALGIGLADARAIRQKAVEEELGDPLMNDLREAGESLEHEARQALRADGVAPSAIAADWQLGIRTQGTDTAIAVPWGKRAAIEAGFAARHRQLFGFSNPGRALIVESLSVEAYGGGDRSALEAAAFVTAGGGNLDDARLGTGRLYLDGLWEEVPTVDRARLAAGACIAGPAVIIEDHGTNIIEPGWRATVDRHGNLLLERTAPRAAAVAMETGVDPVRLELYNNLFMSIAEEMGVVLQNTAHSVNMKERLDYSCALFDGAGALVANAPHMPVHLGSMSESIRVVIAANPEMRDGDVFALNAPYNGGTHLPDVTVVMPVYCDGGSRPAWFCASRGHHADIGGITPGSMPPGSRSVDEEGILFDNFHLVSAGRFREKATRALLLSGRWPARNPGQNIADLKAQVAATARGAEKLRGLASERGRAVIDAYMGHVRANATAAVRRVIAVLRAGEFTCPLDNGAHIHVRITPDAKARRARIDFSASSRQTDDNFNAPRAVAVAAVLYVFRCLVDDDIPLNDGCLAPLDIVTPPGGILNPRYPAAVVAGNVETSQAVVDCLFGALGVVAASQGTMNNLTFGNAHHQYYETICGGAGAGPGFDGASAVHTHMTNSRLTDPEILEWRYPVLLREFSIRRGSGGAGRYRGGDGVVRRILFNQAMQVAILANRRRHAPFGLDGGADGLPGETLITRADGSVQPLDYAAETTVAPGDTITIKTPGGGGFGRKERDRG